MAWHEIAAWIALALSLAHALKLHQMVRAMDMVVESLWKTMEERHAGYGRHLDALHPGWRTAEGTYRPMKPDEGNGEEGAT
jgi:hypothetical protein